MTPAEVQKGVQDGLDQYAQYDANGQPVVGNAGKKILNVELATGSSVIGTVAISQTTPGTTNGVVVNAMTASATTNKVDVGLVNGEAVDVGPGTEAAAIRVTLPTNGTGVIAGVTTVGAVTAITNALPAGTNLMGKVGVDQTTPGTTNAVAIITGQNGVAGGTGADGANVPRVSLATNVALPAGTNAIGKLAPNSGVDIGDVDVTSVTCAAANAKVDVGLINAVTPLMGNGASGTGALRVALVSDGTGRMATLDTLTSGNVGGFTTLVSSTITMSAAGAYATGDYMGTTTSPQSFASAVRVNGGTGVIKSIVISDKITNTNVAMELWILSTTYTAPTDNAAWAISDAEALTVQAIIPIATTGWYASANNQVYVDSTISYPVKAAGGTQTLFYGLVARGTTPAFTSADLTVTIGVLQD